MNKNIVIIGSDLLSAVVACRLAKSAQTLTNTITLVVPNRKNKPTCQEAISPLFKHFLTAMNFNEAEFMASCQAKYHLGCQYVNWSTTQGFETFFLPFYSQLDHYYYPTFSNNIELRSKGYLINAQPDEFFINAKLAKNGLSPQAPYNFPFENEYGYYADSALVFNYLIKQLKLLALSNDRLQIIHQDIQAITKVATNVESAAVNKNSVEKLYLANNQMLPVDWLIETHLAEKTDANINQDYFPINLPAANKAIEITLTVDNSTLSANTNVYSILNHANEYGWIYSIPLDKKMVLGFVYDNRQLSVEQAKNYLHDFVRSLGLVLNEAVAAKNIQATPFQEITFQEITINNYAATQAVKDNVIRLGKAYCYLNPLAGVQSNIELYSADQLAKSLSTNSDLNLVDFNTNLKNYTYTAIDFQLAILGFSNRLEAPFALDFKKTKPPTENLSNIAMCWLNGKAITNNNISQHSFADHKTWNCLLAGLGVFPDPSLLIYVQELEAFDLKALQTFHQNCLSNYSVKFTPEIFDLPVDNIRDKK